jgi:hypothetical protein
VASSGANLFTSCAAGVCALVGSASRRCQCERRQGAAAHRGLGPDAGPVRRSGSRTTRSASPGSGTASTATGTRAPRSSAPPATDCWTA